MKKKLLIASVIITLLALLVTISGVLMSHYIDPNKYKGRISQYVYAKTGQVLVINGNMEWSLFPWIGLKANNLTYYNPPSFTPKVFVAAKEMNIKVKLIPLITHRIEIDNITLDKAVVNLIKNRSGRYNWQNLTQKKPSEESTKENNTISNLSIASLKIKNSKLTWYDQQKNDTTTITHLNISSKGVQFKKPFAFAVQFDLMGDHKKDLQIDLNTHVTVSPDYKMYTLDNIKLEGVYSADKDIKIKLNGNLKADLITQTLASQFKFSADDLKGNLVVNRKQSHIFGNLTTNTFNLQQILTAFGHPLQSKKSDALSKFSLNSNIEGHDNLIKLVGLHAKIDDSDLNGDISVATSHKTSHFNLAINQFHLDDYLANNESKAQDHESDESNVTPSTWKHSGTVKVGQLTHDKLTLTQVAANIDIQHKMTQINPLTANFYGGNLQGSIILDNQQSDKTLIFIKQSIHNMDIKSLLHEFAESDKLSGTTDLNADLTAMTNDTTHFLDRLNGTLQFNLSHGSLQGMDVIYQLSRAHAFLKHTPKPNLPNSKQTNFDSLSTTAAIKNGIMSTDNFALNSAYLKVSGKGTTNLNSKEIRYHLNALAQPRLADENHEVGKEITQYQIPIKVTGRLDKPSVNLDFVELAKLLVTKEIQKPINDAVQKNLNHLKKNLEDKIQNISPGSLLQKLTHKSAEEEKAPLESISQDVNDEVQPSE